VSRIDTVRALNSIFDEYEFGVLRDAIEGADADAVRSGIADLDRLVAGSLAPDVVIQFHGQTGPPEGGRFEGLAEYLRFWRRWLAAFEAYELDHHDYEEVQDCVLLAVRHRGRGRSSGLDFELEQGQRWVFRDGRVAEIHIYETRHDAVTDLPQN